MDRYVDTPFDIINYDPSMGLERLDLKMQGYPNSYT